MPNCKICKTEFHISPQDGKLLANFDMPNPQLCMRHSMQRKLAWRNERHLYRRKCDMCGDSMLAMQFPLSKVKKVYCRNCWYSDKWDAKDHGRDYDFNRPFFEQFFELAYDVPQFNVLHLGTNQNCEYSNMVIDSKDSYLSFSVVESEGIVHSKTVDYSKDCCDCLQITKCELLYDCIDTSESYKSAALLRCVKCMECYLSRDLQDCQNCFGCVNLKHKQYYWYNEKLSKEEYDRRLTEVLKNAKTYEQEMKKFAEFQQQFPVEFAVIRASENCVGNDISHSQDVRNGFVLNTCQNIGEGFRMLESKDCYRIAYGGWMDHCYEMTSSGTRPSNCACCLYIPESSFTQYSMYCFNVDNVFGSIGLRDGETYCIFNRQYNKEEYNVLRAKIIENMKRDKEWGEYFPMNYNFYSYNDGTAHDYFPMTKAQAVAEGLSWQDDRGGTFGKETLTPEQVPASIGDCDDDIIQAVLRCTSCNKNYRITGKELDILRKLGVPVPLQCQECRLSERFANIAHDFTLYKRQCMCELTGHPSHTDRRCENVFQTLYAPDRTKKVFCNPCYQVELGN